MSEAEIQTYDQRLTNRIFGLDLIRGSGILLILFYHGLQLWAPVYPKVWIIGIPAFYALEFFFVLSGFLIGNLLFEKLFNQSDYGIKSGLNFIIRRWLRTFPNYFLFLIIILVLANFNLEPEDPDHSPVRFFTFTQNFYGRANTFFPESWSLAVEEWFYLILTFSAVLAGMLIPVKKRVHFFGVLIAGFVLAIFLVRTFVITKIQGAEFEMQFHKLTLSRIDAPMYGILASLFWFLYRKTIIKYNLWLCITGMVLLCFSVFIYKGYLGSFCKNIVLWPCISIGITLTIPWFALIKDPGGRISFIIRFFSNISYSLYLVHLSVILFAVILPNISSQSPSWLLVYSLSYIVLSITAAIVNYRIFERPILRWRDRMFPEE